MKTLLQALSKTPLHGTFRCGSGLSSLRSIKISRHVPPGPHSLMFTMRHGKQFLSFRVCADGDEENWLETSW